MMKLLQSISTTARKPLGGDRIKEKGLDLFGRKRAQPPLEEGNTMLLHSIRFALAGTTPAVVFLREWAKWTADACRLLYGKGRHIFIIAKKQFVTGNSYTVPKRTEVPQGLGKEELWGLPFLP